MRSIRAPGRAGIDRALKFVAFSQTTFTDIIRTSRRSHRQHLVASRPGREEEVDASPCLTRQQDLLHFLMAVKRARRTSRKIRRPSTRSIIVFLPFLDSLGTTMGYTPSPIEAVPTNSAWALGD